MEEETRVINTVIGAQQHRIKVEKGYLKAFQDEADESRKKSKIRTSLSTIAGIETDLRLLEDRRKKLEKSCRSLKAGLSSSELTASTEISQMSVEELERAMASVKRK